MKTPGPTSGTLPVTSATTADSQVRWQIGQLLQATVVQRSAGEVLLSIGNRQVIAETSLPLEKGQQLTLQVRSLGDLPQLRITSSPNTSPMMEAIRTLLPQQDSMTPLLASLARLAQTNPPPVPPLLREVIRMMVNNLPDTTALTHPQGVRKAIEQSGLFLERQLAQQLNPHAQPTPRSALSAPIQMDFKANLLQLIQRLRNWPGSPAAGPAGGTAKPPVASTGPAATPSATPTAPPPPAASDRPTLNTPAPPNAATGADGKTAAQPVPTSTLSADQLRRVARAGTPVTAAHGTRPVTTPTSPVPTTPAAATTVPATTASPTASTPAVLTAATPPFAGATPAPQAAVEATIDLINRIGNLRTDLLRQAEAALARIQLHQLASQPRDADRGWLEWLFELPVRRGDEFDLWSMRIAREARDKSAPVRRAQPRWSVQLAFDLPGLGPVQAQVTLQGERVSTRFWAGKENTLPLFRAHLQELQRMLGDAGLEVGELDCQPGPMPENTSTAPALIREKA